MYLLVTFLGEMQEWFIWPAWKACVRATVPRVRIPLSPLLLFFTLLYILKNITGEVPEWLNGPVSKTVSRNCGSRVRIPLSPQNVIDLIHFL